MSSPAPNVTPTQTVAELEHVLSRCEASTRAEQQGVLLRGLRLDLFRVRTTAETEFDAQVAPPAADQPYDALGVGLVALSATLQRSLRAHEEARGRTDDTRTQLLLEAQLERLRAMMRNLQRHAAN